MLSDRTPKIATDLMHRLLGPGEIRNFTKSQYQVWVQKKQLLFGTFQVLLSTRHLTKDSFSTLQKRVSYWIWGDSDIMLRFTKDENAYQQIRINYTPPCWHDSQSPSNSFLRYLTKSHPPLQNWKIVFFWSLSNLNNCHSSFEEI